MTAFVLILAALHGIAVVGAALLWPSRVAVIIAALLSAWIAVGIGRSAYTFVDLMAVGIGLWIAWKFIARKPSPKLPRPESVPISSGPGFFWIVAIAVAIFVWNAWDRGQANDPTTVPAGDKPREMRVSAPGEPNPDSARLPRSLYQPAPANSQVSDSRPLASPPNVSAPRAHPRVIRSCAPHGGQVPSIVCADSDAHELQVRYNDLREKMIAARRYGAAQQVYDEQLSHRLSECADNRCYRYEMLMALDKLFAASAE